YGVVFDSEGEVDRPATEALRRDIAGRRIRLRVTESAKPLYEAGRYSRHRICPLNPGDAEAIGVAEGEMVELVGRSGPALRAWAKLDDRVPSGSMPLDVLGRSATAAAVGEPLHVRPLGKVEVT